MADCHIGGWREQKISDLNLKAFTTAVEMCIDKKMDFVLISGDLFNTSLPGIDRLKAVVKSLKSLNDAGIPVYCIAGSHDFSPSGKTMIDVLESAGLCINVVKGRVEEGRLFLKFVTDPKTGAKITGMLGRKGMLERSYYEDLDRESLEAEEGFKIFMFHTAITELKPKELEKMDSSPVSLLPKGFDYYAGGHVHIVQEESISGYKRIVYPGPVFPNSFKELEELEGGMYIYEDGQMKHEPIRVISTLALSFDCDAKPKEIIEDMVLQAIKNTELFNTIVTMRLKGNMKGKPSDIEWRRLFQEYYDKGAYFVMKNSSALTSPEFEEIKVSHCENADELESRIISEHLGQMHGVDKQREEEIVKRLIQSFSEEKGEGERLLDFSERLRKGADDILFG
jgi:exonuclease SbcD